MEYYNNTLCIEAAWLIEEGIFSKDNYDQLRFRNKINVVRRACLNTPALVAYDSIPERFKMQIVAKIGDPRKAASQSELKARIVPDPKALCWYRDEFTLENGEPLPEDKQLEYRTNAEILNAIHTIVSERKPQAKKLNGNTKNLWPNLGKAVGELDKTMFKHSLPVNYRRLQEKYRAYLRDGYQSLVHGGFCNKNSEKINDMAKSWILARWMAMHDRATSVQQLWCEYNALAGSDGFWQKTKPLKSPDAIYNFLHQPEIQPIWYGHRHGELKFKEKFIYHHKTALPTMRDSLWYSDGTKLNYYYKDFDANGRMVVKTTSVYEVMDVYSECLLGYHISDNEDYEAQYNAYRMALEFSQHKPYQISYDNQGGHKKLKNGDFFTRLAHLAIATKPYNGKSKTIENAFKRFQEGFLKKDWFFTGQNIQAKQEESKANLEFINANKHELPTLEEIKAKYKQRRDEWMAAEHPKTGEKRIEMYRKSQNPKAVKLELMDMVDLFWVLREKPVKCGAWGISFEEKKVRYDYMVNLPDGTPDMDWIVRNVNRKFRIKFDPQDFSMIYLYEDTPQGLRFITAAEQKVEVHRGKQEQEQWEAAWLKKVEIHSNETREAWHEAGMDIMAAHNQLPEQHGLVTPALKGINKSKNKKAKQAMDNFGKIQKAMSNAVAAGVDDEDFSEKDLFRSY